MPVFQRTLVIDGITPVTAYAALRAASSTGCFLLESVVPGERWGRYSIVGYRPLESIVLEPGGDVEPFAKLAELAPTDAEPAANVAARFVDAHVGVIPWDIVHYATKVPTWPGLTTPLARLVSRSTVVVLDHVAQTVTIAGPDEASVAQAEADLAEARPPRPLPLPDKAAQPHDLTVDTSDEEYCAVVERAKEYIRAGDAFQIVPARTFSVPTLGADILDVYRSLRVLSPAPYMYLVELPALPNAPAVRIAGASPETLVRVEHGEIALRPIAGTRPRGKNVEQDDALAAEMLADPKEVAEHVMLIDLARNDVGRVADAGTVRVPDRLIVERYSHVMHIVSEVRGKLRADYGPWDVLRATFPAGTLSGAPKVRAMQIIRELEKRPRGYYGGAVGYVTRGRDLDVAIAIRTVVESNGRFEVTAGAGIVADSVPQLEAEETRNKARAALAAVENARRGR